MHFAKQSRAVLAAAVLLALPAMGQAQVTEKNAISVEAHAGVSIPVGTFADINDVGGAYGGTLVWHFLPNWGLRADVDFNLLNDGKADSGVLLGPPVDLTYFGGGIELNFNQPSYQDLPLTFTVNLGAGMTKYNVDETYAPTDPASVLDESYFTLQGGARVGYQLNEYLNLFVQMQTYFIFFDELDSQAYYNPVEGIDSSFNELWLIPVTAGLRVTF